MEKQGQWLLCPYCHGKTRVWIREELIDLQQFHISLLKSQTLRRRVEPDDKSDSLCVFFGETAMSKGGQ